MIRAIVVVHYYANTPADPIRFLLSECTTVTADGDVIADRINSVVAEREYELSSGERVIGLWTVQGRVQSVTIIPND